ncbi:hypothetical protein Tco_0653676 [Tanacetum coccineum]|uniref:Uncharacterized protein n=1 Tax=Tanacetum coccineum TaxID=301880 RepID=A0ABQ4X130_9ASTR
MEKLIFLLKSMASKGHIRQFWSTARIKTADGETNILAKINGKQRTISESSIRRHLKLNDEEGISTLPDNELFENLSLMGYNILPNQRFSFQKAEVLDLQLVLLWRDKAKCASCGRSMGAKQGAGFGIGGKIGKGLYKLGCDRERLKMIKDETAPPTRGDRYREAFLLPLA